MSAAARPIPQLEPLEPAAAIGTTPRPSERRGRDWIVLCIAASLTLAAALIAIDPLPVGVFYDDAQYVILAKALASGQGYRFVNLPGAPAATHFPPGYPLLLALLWKLSPSFPENVTLFKLANAALLALAAVGVFRFARRTLALPSPIALAVTIAGTATIPTLVLSSSVMSEPLFLALLFPLLGFMERETSTRAADGRAELRGALVVGAGLAGITLVRSHGIVLVGAAAAAYLLRGRSRAALVSGAAATLVLVPWLVWVQQHDAALPPLLRGAYGSYGGWFLEGLRVDGLRLLTGTIPDNLATLLWTIARCLVPAGHRVLEMLAIASFAVLSAASLPTLWRRAPALLLFVALYFALVLVWPFSPLRFIWGVWPVLMLFPAVGACALWGSAGSVRIPRARAIAGVASAMVCAGTLWFNTVGYANAWWGANARFHARRILDQLAWVGAKARADDVIGSDTEGAVYLYTGRRAVPVTSFTATEYLREPSRDERIRIMRAVLDRYAPRFVLVTSPPLADAAARLAASDAAMIVRVDSIARGAVYRNRTAR